MFYLFTPLTLAIKVTYFHYYFILDLDCLFLSDNVFMLTSIPKYNYGTNICDLIQTQKQLCQDHRRFGPPGHRDNARWTGGSMGWSSYDGLPLFGLMSNALIYIKDYNSLHSVPSVFIYNIIQELLNLVNIRLCNGVAY